MYLDYHSKKANVQGFTDSALAALYTAVGHTIQRIQMLCNVLGHDRHSNRQMGQGASCQKQQQPCSVQGQVSNAETKFDSKVYGVGVAQHVLVLKAEFAPAFQATCT